MWINRTVKISEKEDVMSSNKDKIIEKYKSGFEDRRAELSRAGKMEFHYTEKLLRRYMKGLPRTIELGCATGYYAYALADICGSYTGVDLSPENIAIFEKKLSEKPLTTARGEPVKCRVGDATDLSDIPDGSYDAVLCLGPMYHLPPEERRKVFAECYRIASPGALLAFAYICTTGLVAGASCFDGLREVYPNECANHCVFDLGTDDIAPGLFYYTSPDDIERAAEAAGLEVVADHGLDFFFMASAINAAGEERMPSFYALLDRMVDEPRCTGAANHALVVARKR